MHATLGDAVLFVIVPLVVTAVWFSVVANVVTAMRRLLRAGRVRRAIDAVTGGLLVALGVRLAVQ
jgi:threonine/homoserine/homoserine lactone efflux protein